MEQVKKNVSLLLGNPKEGHQPVTLHYCNVFEPRPNLNGDLRYSARIVISKEDKKAIASIRKIEEALCENAKTLLGGKLPKSFNGIILKDGDSDEDNEKDDESLHGCYFFNATKDGENGAKRPGLVKREGGQLVPATDEDIFSGGKAVVDINLFLFGVPDASKTGSNRGISAGLTNILAVPGGTRIGGGRSSESAFGDIEIGDEYGDL